MSVIRAARPDRTSAATTSIEIGLAARGHGRSPGANGQGKTSLLEAVAWVASARSFRGVPDAALVRTGARAAIVRVDDRRPTGAPSCSRPRSGPSAATACGSTSNPLQRTRDLLGLLRVTVFSPDDLRLVKGGPGGPARLPRRPPRRDRAALRGRPQRLRAGAPPAQRAAAAAGAATPTASPRSTCSTTSSPGRAASSCGAACGSSSGSPPRSGRPTRRSRASRRRSTRCTRPSGPRAPRPTDGLRGAAPGGARASAGRREIDRGVTLVGPHRDEWRLRLDGLDARNHASQGEQRTLALAPAPRRPPAVRRDHRHRAGAAPRRRVQRARPRPRGSAGRAPAGRADAGDDRVGGCRRACVAERRLRVHAGRVEDDT